MKFRNLAMLVAVLVITLPKAIAQSDQGSQAVHKSTQTATSTKGSHGGMLQKVDTRQIETVIEAGELRVFVYDQQGKPIDLTTARGLATLQKQGSSKKYRYDLFPDILKDKSATSLTATADLTQYTGQKVELSIQLDGLQEQSRRPLTFKSDVLVPMTEAQQIAAAIEAQGVCPVSGGELGSMGSPIAVTIGDQTVYVCCVGCVDAVKENPEKYLTPKPPFAISPITEEDTTAIAAQELCPVMDEPLGGMGVPYKTVVEGRVVYLCCPGCAKKLHANAALYLGKLADQGVIPPLAR